MEHETQRAFMLGLRVAEYVHGIRQKADAARDVSDRILSTLQKIDSGELTLVDTAEEVIAKAPPGMPELFRQRVPAMLSEARRDDKEMANLMLRHIYGNDVE